jgi:dipeptidyl aminopeptidase/acylaminoacyl peptidase
MQHDRGGGEPMSEGTILRREAMRFPAEALEQFPYLERTEAWAIAYLSGGLRVKGYLARPKASGPHPCVIYNRGGNREFAAITPDTVARLLCRIAGWGYVVAASQYRGNAGGEGREQFGGQDVEDVLNLIPLLEREPDADASRIGMYAGSRGGMMTYLALTRSARMRAAVVRCGVSDLTDWREERNDMQQVFAELIPGFDPADARSLIERSAVYWPEKLCKSTPLLLLQGTADWRVNPLASLRFAEALFKARHPFRLVLLEGSDHALSEHLAERDRLAREWFDRFVRDGAPLPNLEPHGD